MAAVIGAFGLIFLFSNMGAEAKEEVDLKKLQELVDEGTVGKIVILNGQNAQIYMIDSSKNQLEMGARYFVTIANVPTFEKMFENMQRKRFSEDAFVPVFVKDTVDMWDAFISILPVLLIGGFVLMALSRASSGGGMGRGGDIFKVGKSKAKLFTKEEGLSQKFSDVAGMDEAKEEVLEFVAFLTKGDNFKRLGAKMPSGCLLSGPPGTGKTLLARAVAGEAGVPFFSCSGSDFLELFVGVGPSRVRDLFAQARAQAPCIVFIDEIDAIGRARGKGNFYAGNDERENTLNQLLVEMDGFGGATNVIVLASTNRADVLDPALLRPGRFDRQVVVGLPDLKGRKDIFSLYLPKLKIAEAASQSQQFAEQLALLTPQFSGADIRNVCNEAALIAARGRNPTVDLQHFEAAVDRVIGGLEKKSKKINQEERETVARHECGHAIAGWLLRHTPPLLKVSIVPRGSAALGFAQYLPREQGLHSKHQLLDMMAMTLGGRAAEELFVGQITTGASDDLKKVTEMAYGMVMQWGMSNTIPPMGYRKDENKFYSPFSEKAAHMMDDEVHQIVSHQYQRVKDLLLAHKDQHAELTALLLTKDTLSGEDLRSVLGERPHGSRMSTYEEMIQGFSDEDLFPEISPEAKTA